MGDRCDYCYRPSVIRVLPKRTLLLRRPKWRRVCGEHWARRQWRVRG